MISVLNTLTPTYQTSYYTMTWKQWIALTLCVYYSYYIWVLPVSCRQIILHMSIIVNFCPYKLLATLSYMITMIIVKSNRIGSLILTHSILLYLFNIGSYAVNYHNISNYRWLWLIIKGQISSLIGFVYYQEYVVTSIHNI